MSAREQLYTVVARARGRRHVAQLPATIALVCSVLAQTPAPRTMRMTLAVSLLEAHTEIIRKRKRFGRFMIQEADAQFITDCGDVRTATPALWDPHCIRHIALFAHPLRRALAPLGFVSQAADTLGRGVRHVAPPQVTSTTATNEHQLTGPRTTMSIHRHPSVILKPDGSAGITPTAPRPRTATAIKTPSQPALSGHARHAGR